MSLEIRESPYVFGIDLGTSHSSISIYQKGKAITLKIDNGRLAMPSVVFFPKDNKENEVNIKVGSEAKKRLLSDPERTFSSIKSLMRNNEWNNDEILKAKFKIGDRQFTPTDIAAEILKKLVEDAQVQFEVDLLGQITQAVICVPANTTDEYRFNVYKAAVAAGIGTKNENNEVIVDEKGRPKGISMIDEPVAAAIAYGREMDIFEGAEKEQTIMIYDLGGGTFDVTILKVDSTKGTPIFTTLATKGIQKLGGDDFDRVIMDFVAKRFLEETGIDILTPAGDNKGTSAKSIKQAQQILKDEAEKAKIELAAGSNTASIMLNPFLKDGEGKVHEISYEIKKSEFLEQIKPLLAQTDECVQTALKVAKLEIDDINRVILVGGSTKAEWIKDFVSKLGKTPYMAENVDVIVSQGAAIYGALKPIDEQDQGGFIFENKTNHHLGIELENGEFSPIIPAGASLDLNSTERHSSKEYGNQEDQSTLQITVWKTQEYIEYQEEDGKKVPTKKVFINTRDNKYDCIGDFVLTGIPKGRRGSQRIVVEMEIKEDNTLEVNAKVLSTNESMTANIHIEKA